MLRGRLVCLFGVFSLFHRDQQQLQPVKDKKLPKAKVTLTMMTIIMKYYAQCENSAFFIFYVQTQKGGGGGGYYSRKLCIHF